MIIRGLVHIDASVLVRFVAHFQMERLAFVGDEPLGGVDEMSL
jgi:hypothetical protein